MGTDAVRDLPLLPDILRAGLRALEPAYIPAGRRDPRRVQPAVKNPGVSGRRHDKIIRSLRQLI